jgi:uncharacterized protein involved in outer membrane biogenesis
MKTILKWLAGITLVLIALAVVFLLSLDTILRVTAENRIRAQTGMDAEIGKFHVGLLEPVMTIKDLKIHNPPAFGGTPFLTIPEIHIEYDREALLKNQLHFTLVRFNLAELVIVKNEAGQTNLFALGVGVPLASKPAPDGGKADLKIFKQRTGMDFAGIDALNVSIGTARFIDLKNPANNREQKFGIDNLVFKNIKSPADLTGLTLMVALRGGDFFKNVFGSGFSF